jgi:hypothetical protein
MLGAAVSNCIRETVEAELRPRDDSVRASISASANKLAARGMSVSTAAFVERGRIGCNELTIRAEITWLQIQRCYAAYGGAHYDQLAADLQQQVAELLSKETMVVHSLVDALARTDLPPAVQTHIQDALKKRRDELLRKMANEARFYAQSLERSQAAEPSGITIHGNVGALQTGASAHATIHIEIGATGRFVEGLEALRAAVEHAADVSSEQRAETKEMLADLLAAARAPKPNGAKIAGLLNGVATIIKTAASLRGAWDLVRDVARLIGISLL